MASATIIKAEPEPDRGPDLFEGVKGLHLKLTSQEAKAVLVALSRVGGPPSTTMRGEIDTVMEAIYKALGIESPWAGNWDKVKRYADRNDLLVGTLFFRKGGAHV